MDYAVQFVERHQPELIQRVTLVDPIVDKLLSTRVISNEMYANIRAAFTSQDKMRMLYSVLQSRQSKAAFYEALNRDNPYLVQDLAVPFVDKHRDELSVHMDLKSTADELNSQGHTELSFKFEKALTRSNNTTLSDVLKTLDEPEKELFYTSLKVQNPHLVQKLDMPKGFKPPLFDGNILGKGSEDTIVYKAKFDERTVAVKRVKKKLVKIALIELELLRKLDGHPNVVRYFYNWVDDKYQYIILELASSTLKEYIEEKDKRISELDPVSLLQQIMSGLAYLHCHKIVHRDIKPTNILLSQPDINGNIKAMISDFGLGKQLDQDKSTYSKGSGSVGTLHWMAPEAHESESVKPGYSVDIFSAGCVFYYVLSEGSHAFGKNILKNIFTSKHELDKLKADVHQHVLAKHLIVRMLSFEPKSRPTAETVLHHPLFWDSWQQLDFMQEISDLLEYGKDTVTHLEENSADVVKGDWTKHITDGLMEDLQRRRRYDGCKVQHLLRAIRNCKHHYSDKRKEEMGSIPEGLVSYFTTRFPTLLLHTYEAMIHCGVVPKLLPQNQSSGRLVITEP
ncbi:serine/threonine-protein kinase/endoribonuclease IRE1-like [Megalops cyprinoides]|uniref:serine/threonine-protein kinase/endoribonuclease IRE1-like n=1 Tax=Megalops cyprinoides TaxID=118141 RepID=UPI001863B407|nr:serine/threonine-protein kinase/endoribonuclease IRE1-like [Megalops cyprinoides]